MAEYSEERMNFGKNLRFYRKKKGYSQNELATLCEISRSYICDVECGRRNIGFDNIVMLAKKLNVSVSKLFKVRNDE